MLIFSARSPSSGTKRSPRALPARAGFTLIELMVVMAIIVLVTGLLLARQSRFNSSTLLRSLSYSVALTIRQAQTYGTSVRENAVGSASFVGIYGVWFNGGSSYTLYVDVNKNGIFDGGDVTVQTYKVGAGYSINTYCAYALGSMSCSGSCPPSATQNKLGVGSCTPSAINSLSIYFKRPNPDALFTTVPAGPQTWSGAYIELISGTDTGNTRSIDISNTGEIAVDTLGS
ncbi:MAG: prepilin-type N-terminal cleavage/methylation domain-containing protein [Patescibacteria group bacterium]|nr:prepilin-type N-terminal cleavage/methylation domain-containing protein [Patescibacteria group bacterium]